MTWCVMQYTCSYPFMSPVQCLRAYIYYITFVYNVLSMKNTGKRQHAWVCLCNVTK